MDLSAVVRASVFQDVFRAGAAKFDSKTGNFSENAVRPGTHGDAVRRDTRLSLPTKQQSQWSHLSRQ
jgi:hypothetical protein